MTTSASGPEGEWRLNEAEVSGGLDEGADGWVRLWFRHAATGLVADARIPGRDEEEERKLEPLLLATLEEKVAWKLQIPGRKWDQAGAGQMPEWFR